VDPISERVRKIRWELGQPERVRQLAAEREAHVRELAARFVEWAECSDVRPSVMRLGRRRKFSGWEIGETDRGDRTYVRIPSLALHEPPEKTWRLWVSPDKQLTVVLVDHRSRDPRMRHECDRPLSEFPIEAVEEGIARIVVKAGKSWP
jgi:hypothetical protein